MIRKLKATLMEEIIIKVARHALVFGGTIFCLLFFSLDTAFSQQIQPRAYLFVEVRDTTGKAVTDASVTVSNAGGTQLLSEKTDNDGVAKAELDPSKSDHHFNLEVSKSGYRPSDQVFFLYPALGHFYSIAEFSTRVEGLNIPRSRPINIVLSRIPVTPTERQVAEGEEKKRRLLLAVKRGDAMSLRKLLEEGVKANTVDGQGVPAIAWAALAGDSETIKVLLAAGADVGPGNKLGHQALLIYLAESRFLDTNARRSGTNGNTELDKDLLERRDETVRRLIEAGAATNVQNSPRGTVLNRAIAQAPWFLSIETIKAVIASGADVNAFDGIGQTALMLAARKDSIAIVKTLLESGATVNAKDNQGRTALMYVTQNYESGSEVAKALVATSADVNAVDENGQTALMLAAQSRSMELIKILLESNASIGAKDKQGMTALMHASKFNSADVSKALIHAGASIDEKDPRGWTALMHAVSKDPYGSKPEVVKALIVAGADVHAVSADGQTALMLAAHQYDGQYDGLLVKILLEAGASVNAKDKQGQTALIRACQTNPPIDLVPIDVKLFLKAGASINEQDARGQTALMYAAILLPETAKALIAAGANVKAVNADGQTALMVAAQTSSIEGLKTLLESGASVNEKDKQGRTALILAAHTLIYAETVQFLIQAGSDVNATDNDGRTALMALAARGEIPSDEHGNVSLLLKAGAKVNLVDKKGRTALVIAKEAGNLIVIRLLEEAEIHH